MSNALWFVVGLALGLVIPWLIEYWVARFARKQLDRPLEAMPASGDSSYGSVLNLPRSEYPGRLNTEEVPSRKPWRIRRKELEANERKTRAKIESFQE